MRADVTRYFRRCRICSGDKPSQDQPNDRMVRHVKVARPWEIISTDIVGPPPRSKHGNNFILVVTENLSKLPLFLPSERLLRITL